jgi:hypothetical protein
LSGSILTGQLRDFLLSPGIRLASEQRIDWDYNDWSTKVGGLHADAQRALEALERGWAREDGISRVAVRKVGKGNPVALLVASMAWGFGNLPYGPARTVNMLRTPGFEGCAAQIIRGAALSPAEGFQALFSDGRPKIKGLSIAMGSKLLYFASPPRTGKATPVVYDQVVYKALVELTPELKSLDPRRRRTGVEYARVCQWMSRVAKELGDGRRADDIEYALFQYPRWARRQESLKLRGKRR